LDSPAGGAYVRRDVRGGIRGLRDDAGWLALFVVLAGGCGSGHGAAHDGAADAPAGRDEGQLDAGPQDTSAPDGNPEEVGGSDAGDAGDDRRVTPDAAADAGTADAGTGDAGDSGRDASGDVPPQVATWDSPTAVWDQSLWN
jgi:hypothetical protein